VSPPASTSLTARRHGQRRLGKHHPRHPAPGDGRDRTRQRHIAAFPPLEITLPWETPSGEPTTAPLLLYSRERNALDRRHFNAYVWKAALAAAGVEPSRANGMRALRHFYASVLLDAGESIKALSEYLGHSDPGSTLHTYTHLLPTSEQRTRQTVDRALTGTQATADGLTTAYELD
jgi:integrase